MKVKEILEILHSNSKKVSENEIIGLLDNIGIEDATLETDVDVNVTKKLSKRYGVEFKTVKPKKEAKPQVVKVTIKDEPKKEEKPVETPLVAPEKPKKVEVKKEVKEEKPIEVKKEVAPAQQPKKEDVKKETKQDKKQEVDRQHPLRSVVDHKATSGHHTCRLHKSQPESFRQIIFHSLVQHHSSNQSQKQKHASVGKKLLQTRP